MSSSLAITPKPDRTVHQPVQQRAVVYLPEETFLTYETQAEERGMTVEDILRERLCRCVTHTASQPIYVDDTARRELVKITGGRLLTSASDLVNRVKGAFRVRIGTVVVDLDERTKQRLEFRAKAERKTIEEITEREVRRGLMTFCRTA